MIKHFWVVGLLVLSGFMSGCDQKAGEGNEGSQPVAAVKPAAVDVASLSENNEADIKADWKKVVEISNTAKDEVLALNKEMAVFAGKKDEAQVKAKLKEMKEVLSKTNEKLMTFGVKSKELHNLILQQVKLNELAGKMTEISNIQKPSEADITKIREQQQEIASLQMSFTKDTIELQKKFKVQ